MEPFVRELFHTCHPTWDKPAPQWFFAYPTLVVLDEDRIMAYSSYSMNTNDDNVLAIFLQDTGVAPHARGRGLSRALMNARLEVGRTMGAKFAAGMTQPSNVQMLGLLKSMGFQEVAKVPGAYASEDGILFTLDLTENV